MLAAMWGSALLTVLCKTHNPAGLRAFPFWLTTQSNPVIIKLQTKERKKIMSNKIKAALFVALYTVGLVLGIGLIQIMLNYLQPTLAEVGATFAVLLFAYAVKMMYDLRLGQLEARDRLNEIANK